MPFEDESSDPSPHGLDDYRYSQRCSCCRLSPGLCVCSELPFIELPNLGFTVIQHRTEIGKQSNTGALIPHLLANSSLLKHGLQEGPFDLGELQRPEIDYLLLFPRADATEITPERIPVAVGRPTQIVVLDGTWSKARRMARRIAPLISMPALKFSATGQQPPLLAADQRLRKSPAPGLMFTLEAVVACVQQLGYVEQAALLNTAMQRVVRGRLHGRGKLRRSDL